jgi:hypothetical protein
VQPIVLASSVPAINSDAMIHLVITVVVIGLVFFLLTWLVGYIGIPEPFRKVILAILACAAVIWLLRLLLAMT